MDLALPALTIFLLVIPGLVFNRFFLDHQFSDAWKGSNDFIGIVLRALIPALLLHVIFIGIFQFFPAFRLRYEYLGYMISGIQSDATTKDLFLVLGESKWKILLYFLVVSAVGAFSGKQISKLVINRRLDISFPMIFKFNEWFYYLSGQVLSLPGVRGDVMDIDLVVVDVLTSTDGGNILYSGILERYTLTKDGIETIGLRTAGRWDGKDLIPLPGDYLVLQGKNILNLHFNYLGLEAVEPENPPKGAA